MNPNVQVIIGRLKLKNPVLVASGTFGYAQEFTHFIDLKKLGAIVTKTITLHPRKGNPAPRTCETPAGMLNSIGLENPGLEVFIQEKLPFLKKIGVPIIISIASEEDPEEFIVLVKRLTKIKEASAIELNISCPNIGHKSLIAQDSKAAYNLIRAVRKVTTKTLITKLSPNVTDITEAALAAQNAGSDAISLINTLTGMSIDVETKKPRLSTITGGLSGPAIRPIAVRMVWEVYQKIKIPIIGMGGIIDTFSALEFFLAGATAIAIGSANFVQPRITIEIIAGLKKYLAENKIKDIRVLVGALKV
ncbi:MAG: dihydroorotate dehydrogenase B catalytic subunit [Omnitrophica WOR_2 bacterium RIFCSPLOWO2_01_FULL_41_12]|nr:MAG: dihydroorotate dehydrogenase B catalytic subunit [Omnitrophica WOR_2 bacterium RIFCSPLOWO2_01_FULL_41_12]